MIVRINDKERVYGLSGKEENAFEIHQRAKQYIHTYIYVYIVAVIITFVVPAVDREVKLRMISPVLEKGQTAKTVLFKCESVLSNGEKMFT